VTTLVELLERGLEKVGGLQKDLATALGISRPRVNRLLKNERGGYQLGIAPCYKLAELLKEDELMVLRVAGKGWLADLVESHQRKGVKEKLTAAERSILDDYHIVAERLPDAAGSLRDLLGQLATEARTKRPKRGTKKKAK
jgi:transcriptional regulator with XRE-family HTH domain